MRTSKIQDKMKFTILILSTKCAILLTVTIFYYLTNYFNSFQTLSFQKQGPLVKMLFQCWYFDLFLREKSLLHCTTFHRQ